MGSDHIKFENDDEVMQHYLKDKENNQVVLFEGVVYHVKEYAPEHPGGDHYIMDRLGKDITEDFEEAEHTKSARKVLAALPVVGSVDSDDKSTDS
jgi:cytochrome b involved in lipid metabolism